MKFTRFLAALVIALPLVGWQALFADAPNGPGCFAASSFHESWIKVGERTCLKCHVPGGEAAESSFLLSVDSNAPQNCSAFTQMALELEDDGRPRLIVKATGGLDHGGGEVVKADSSELRILQEFARSVRDKPTPSSQAPITDDLASFFDGVAMLSDQRLLRRLTLSLAARLPTDDERRVVASQGLKGIEPVLAAVMTEEAFYQRLQEGFNDILLTRGYNGNGEDALS